MRPHDVAVAQSPELTRRAINDRLPNYGPALPDIGVTPDGKLFTAAGVLYQAQNGAWVAV